jgi:hypothetical protein
MRHLESLCLKRGPGALSWFLIGFESRRSPRSAFALLPNPPKRTHAEPRECYCEANCKPHASETNLSCLISRVFMPEGHAAAGRHHQEDKPCNLKPQLVQDAPNGPRGRRQRTRKRSQGAAALGLLGRDPGDHP